MINNLLNPRYTFSNFVAGKSNSFAYQACFEILESPGTLYNPLFIFGEPGTGKTHLINAIGHQVLMLNRYYNVIYVYSDMFAVELLDAIKERKMEKFHNKYRTADILLIDSLDFLIGKSGCQEELLYTFEHLYNAGKKIIITSCCMPGELKGFNKLLISRLSSGLVVEVKPPDSETRKAIIRKKVADENITMSDDVLEYIGNIEVKNVREVEGLIARALAYSSFKKEKLDLATTKEAFQEFSTYKEKKS